MKKHEYMMFDPLWWAELEAIAPGLVFGEVDQVCAGCQRVYVVRVTDCQLTQSSTCPFCFMENEA